MSNPKYNKPLLRLFLALLLVISGTSMAAAQPYGTGKFGANVPYGGETSLAISTGGNAAIQVTPTDNGALGTASNAVTVTSTDVVGYKLYIRSLSSTNMINGASTLTASSNGTLSALSTNTWGYNTDASTNFLGMTTSDVLIKNAVGPFSAGDTTTVTYGVKVDNTKLAGNYVTSVVYTAVPQTQ
jgi:uncharacterized protein (UPF0333 family)